MTIRNLLTTAFVVVVFGATAFAQDGVIIDYDGQTRHPSAVLEAYSTDQGFLVPRVQLSSTTDVATISSPATSLLVYNTTPVSDVVEGYYYWSGSAWLRLVSDNTPIDGSGAATRVAFWNGTNSLTSDANLYWDDTNNELGIGVTSPSERLHIGGGGNLLMNGTGTGLITMGHSIRSANRAELHLHANGANSVSEIFFGHDARTDANVRWTISDRGDAAGQLIFYEGNSLSGSGFEQRMTLLSGGNVGIGVTDPDQKLEVNGQVKITGGAPAAGKVLISSADGTGSWSNSLPDNDPGYIWNQTGTQASSNFHVSGIGYADASFRAPIFYDSDATTYYWNGSASTSMRVEGDIQIGYGSGSDDDYLYFDVNSEYIQWDNSDTEFRFSDDIDMIGADIREVDDIYVHDLYDRGTGSQIEVHDDFDMNDEDIYDAGIIEVNELRDGDGSTQIYVNDDMYWNPANTDYDVYLEAYDSEPFFRPSSALWGFIGNSSRWWYRMYADAYYYDTPGNDWVGFDSYDDITLLNGIVMDTVWDPILEHHVCAIRQESIPKCITNYEENGRFINTKALDGLFIGTFRQMDKETKERDRRLDARTEVLANALNIDFNSAEGITESSRTVSDFGMETVSDESTFVKFSSEFRTMISFAEALPVVTVTSNQPGNNAYVTKVENDGFTIVMDKSNQTTISWIAMAKVTLDVNSGKEEVDQIADVFKRGPFKPIPNNGKFRNIITAKDVKNGKAYPPTVGSSGTEK